MKTLLQSIDWIDVDDQGHIRAIGGSGKAKDFKKERCDCHE